MKKPKKQTKLIDYKEDILEVDMLKYSRENYYAYGMSVIEDRAIPDYRDGMSPVNRRSLWASHTAGFSSKTKVVKAARVVGDAMGRFHPHGDQSLYKAVVGMSRNSSNVALIDTSGNWGTMSDNRAAAMRYTEMRLSKFSDIVLFNKFYLPVVDYVPNYDGSSTEPLLLPALLPIVLLNGREGIAPGAATYIPTFTSKSILETLDKIYGAEKLTSKLLYKCLKFTSVFGGREKKIKDEEAIEQRMNVFKKRKGKVVLHSTSEYDERSRTLTVTKFARVSKMETLLGKLLTVAGVAEARDDSTKKDRYGTVTIVLKRESDPSKLKKLLKLINTKYLATAENYLLNFTERYTDKELQCAAKLRPMSITEMLTKWVEWRTQLEVKACAYWIAEAEKRIKHLELLMIAVDNRKLIIESLDKTCTQAELDLWLAKKLRISVEDAATIYDLRVKQLRKLEKSSLLERKKEIEKEKKDLKTRMNKPLVYMQQQLKEFEPLF
jgi:DNA gyrase/topoisomerase IV subunit A